MRKITAGLFISLDGVVEAPDQWHFPYFNDEMGAAVDATLGSADTVLLGRRTYDSFAGAWPEREAAGGEDADFAKKLGDARKIVVSNQQLAFTWRNSEQLTGEFADAVTALKNEPGGTRFFSPLDDPAAGWTLESMPSGGRIQTSRYIHSSMPPAKNGRYATTASSMNSSGHRPKPSATPASRSSIGRRPTR